jgi:uncharacterized protein YgiM (DUF1202 family)
MQKKNLAVATLSVALLASCADTNQFSKTQIGAALGTLAGAAAGAAASGKGDKTKGVLIGAMLGGLAGGAVGNMLDERDRARLAQSTEEAIVTGRNQAWSNPDSGVQARTVVREAPPQREQREIRVLKDKVQQVPPLEFIGEDYVAAGKVNVRGGPGTDYKVVGDLQRGESTRVVGKVIGANWYMISEGDAASGFVSADLLRPGGKATVAEAKPAAAAPEGEVTQASVSTTATCRVVTQQVTLRNGETANQDVKACRGPRGWEIIET